MALTLSHHRDYAGLLFDVDREVARVAFSGAQDRATIRQRVVSGTDQRTSVPGAADSAFGTSWAFVSAAAPGTAAGTSVPRQGPARRPKNTDHQLSYQLHMGVCCGPREKSTKAYLSRIYTSLGPLAKDVSSMRQRT